MSTITTPNTTQQPTYYSRRSYGSSSPTTQIISLSIFCSICFFILCITILAVVFGKPTHGHMFGHHSGLTIRL